MEHMGEAPHPRTQAAAERAAQHAELGEQVEQWNEELEAVKAKISALMGRLESGREHIRGVKDEALRAAAAASEEEILNELEPLADQQRQLEEKIRGRERSLQ